MNLSLVELDTLAKRATRGAGYPWGIAEEAGKATRWLCTHDLDGIAQLSLLLQHNMNSNLAAHRPAVSGNVWRSSQTLCPLITGCYLSDSADILMANTLEIYDVVAPALLLPFVASVASRNRQCYTIDCNGAAAISNGNSLAVVNALPEYASVVSVGAGGSVNKPQEQQLRVVVENGQLGVLHRYARKTYAPETEQSRLTGAGAGLTDND